MSKIKILAVGDPHAKKDNTRTIQLLAEKICELIDKEKPDKCIVLGDLANDFEKMHLSAWISINEFLIKIAEKVPVVYIVGNHDMLNNQVFMTNEHFFSFMNHKNVQIIDKACHEMWVDYGIMYIPYVPPGRFAEAVKSIGEIPQTNVIFCHQEFKGAKMGAIESKIGDEWSEAYPLVISGHIHDRDMLQSNILYTGAPYQTSFGDNDKKSVEIIELSQAADNVAAIDHRPVDLGMPKKINIRCDCDGFMKIEVDPKDDVRVLLKDTTENIKKIKKTSFYGRITKICKVVAKPIDPVKFKKFKEGKKFIDILGEIIQSEESPNVTAVYQEVLNEIKS